MQHPPFYSMIFGDRPLSVTEFLDAQGPEKALNCGAMSRSVPTWKQVPIYAQKALSVRGFGNPWFDAQTDRLRLTVLNLYVKLSGMRDLWRFVKQRDSAPLDPNNPNRGVGCLEFLTDDANVLKRELTHRADMTVPQDSTDQWEVREKRIHAALHFKHFTGWGITKVQAHIDKTGLGFGGAFSLPLIGPLVMAGPHLADYCRHGWEDVFAIRDLLLKQGWDRKPLLGVDAR